MKPGDKVSIVVYPLRNNEKGGQYISITLRGRQQARAEAGRRALSATESFRGDHPSRNRVVPELGKIQHFGDVRDLEVRRPTA